MSNNYMREVYKAAQRDARKIVQRDAQRKAQRLDRASVSLATFYSIDSVAQLVRELNASIYNGER